MLSKKIYSIFLISFFLQFLCGGNFAISETGMDEKFIEYIQKGYIELGMTKEEVQASWGKPKTISHRKTNDYGEVWVYVPNWKFKNRLFFYNGILVKTEPAYLVVSKMEGHGVISK